MNTDKIYAEQVANEYAPKDDSQVVALKKLDARAKLPATIFVYSCGIISALILGFGMCLSMGLIVAATTTVFVAGIFICIVGLIGLALTYPVYLRMLANGKRKYAQDILTLARHISDEE